MICPLFIIANCDLGDIDDIDIDCREKECAWWGDSARKCAVKSLEAIAINLREIANSLEEED